MSRASEYGISLFEIYERPLHRVLLDNDRLWILSLVNLQHIRLSVPNSPLSLNPFWSSDNVESLKLAAQSLIGAWILGGSGRFGAAQFAGSQPSPRSRDQHNTTCARLPPWPSPFPPWEAAFFVGGIYNVCCKSCGHVESGLTAVWLVTICCNLLRIIHCQGHLNPQKISSTSLC